MITYKGWEVIVTRTFSGKYIAEAFQDDYRMYDVRHSKEEAIGYIKLLISEAENNHD